MLKFSEIFEFSRENSYFERIRTVRMVRMVRSLADRTFQLCWVRRAPREVGCAVVHADASLAVAEYVAWALHFKNVRRGQWGTKEEI